MADLDFEIDGDNGSNGYEEGLDGKGGEVGSNGLLEETLRGRLAAGEGEHCKERGVGNVRNETGSPGAQAGARQALGVGAEPVVDEVIDAGTNNGSNDASNEDAAGEPEAAGDVDLAGSWRGGEILGKLKR